MERQTLQQQTPVYHVCQACGGEGCEACEYLFIVEGDLSPINVVIGIKTGLASIDLIEEYLEDADGEIPFDADVCDEIPYLDDLEPFEPDFPEVQE
ncbi:hypothetical protein QMX34_000021 [Aeromonas hydrophila]|nr:hypothetical protein [Aeromonas hydrophila]